MGDTVVGARCLAIHEGERMAETVVPDMRVNLWKVVACEARRSPEAQSERPQDGLRAQFTCCRHQI